ncbi:ammonium transporter [Methylobrevis pamukkalensis]|uniref:Ammonium transporter n=1 Tax=Methylobrevis pamukkalensis TaxID=1439726 RepID=A0A1E3H5F2_9HYPH|nr:ammonium transporter [Methylobrevis pamukkalensis]ODN71547.1 Ammonium transporter NrgA [Methylobrevis pamukkalensis]
MVQATLDTFWLVVAGTLVLFMQPGFLGLEGGSVRAKNNVNVAAKNFTDFCFSALCFWAVGFGLMFGASHNGWFGSTGVFFRPLDGFSAAFLFFQVMFCSTSATIVSGAVAERITFVAYLALVILMAVCFYPVYGHWAWGAAPFESGSGWLRQLGFHDFAGSTVVHSVGGWAALATILVIGPRVGRFDGSRFPVQAQGVPFTMFGVFLIFIGWIGFNGGSTLRFDDSVPQIILNTMLAGCTGGMMLTLLHMLPGRPASIFDIGNGCIAGLVAITASADVATPVAAVALGFLGAAMVVPVRIMLDRAEIDDAVGAVPAHLAPGILGTLAVPFVDIADAPPTFDALIHAVGIQFLGVAVCAVWSFGGVFVALRLLGLFIPLRVEVQMERRGLNVAEHGVVTDMAHLIGRFGALGQRHGLRDLFDQATTLPRSICSIRWCRR